MNELPDDEGDRCILSMSLFLSDFELPDDDFEVGEYDDGGNGGLGNGNFFSSKLNAVCSCLTIEMLSGSGGVVAVLVGRGGFSSSGIVDFLFTGQTS